MAGHSKWANIQHRKKRQDAKRGKLFTRLIREVSVAARDGGGDPEANPRLRLAMDKANAGNVPKDTTDRAIKKASGESGDVRYEDARYEGYASGGVAVMVDCLTDNRNRTVAEVRHAFNKYGGNLGTDGSVAYLFKNLGVITFEPGANEEKIMELALDLGADDIVNNEDGSVDVLTTPEVFGAVREGMLAGGLEPAAAEITMRPEIEIELEGDWAEKVLKLIDALEELDDVQDVYSNADFPEEVLAG